MNGSTETQIPNTSVGFNQTTLFQNNLIANKVVNDKTLTLNDMLIKNRELGNMILSANDETYQWRKVVGENNEDLITIDHYDGTLSTPQLTIFDTSTSINTSLNGFITENKNPNRIEIDTNSITSYTLTPSQLWNGLIVLEMVGLSNLNVYMPNASDIFNDARFSSLSIGNYIDCTIEHLSVLDTGIKFTLNDSQDGGTTSKTYDIGFDVFKDQNIMIRIILESITPKTAQYIIIRKTTNV